MALKVGGRGDVSETHILWRIPTGAPYVSSLAFHEGLVYMANGNGIVTATDGATGKKVWQERLRGIFTASPVVADNKIYFLSETGEMVVLRPGREPHILARNPLEERTVASPAISKGQIFIRSDKHLFCIGR
jgi:outer membrane protein assembly factor BamB